MVLNKRDKVHSSKETRNVNLVLKYTGNFIDRQAWAGPNVISGGDEGFVATHFIIRAPQGEFSAPVQNGLIFVSKEKLSEGLLRVC